LQFPNGNLVLNNLSVVGKIRSFIGEQYNQVGNFDFYVENPWYLSFWMIFDLPIGFTSLLYCINGIKSVIMKN
jgi:hypothetical protein